MTPLGAAAYLGHVEIIQWLLDQDFSPLLKTEKKLLEGMTALGWAAMNGHTEVCRLLLAKGANVNSQAKEESHNDKSRTNDNTGITPLHSAAFDGNIVGQALQLNPRLCDL
jgi:ankyrin repeat protein